MAKKIKVITPDNYVGFVGEYIDTEPCATYDNCADVMTPKQAMLKMLAGGQVADLRRRSAFYDDEEMEDYTEATYPCDYVELYNDYLAQITPYSKNKDNIKQSNKVVNQEDNQVKATDGNNVNVQEQQPDTPKVKSSSMTT